MEDLTGMAPFHFFFNPANWQLRSLPATALGVNLFCYKSCALNPGVSGICKLSIKVQIGHLLCGSEMKFLSTYSSSLFSSL